MQYPPMQNPPMQNPAMQQPPMPQPPMHPPAMQPSAMQPQQPQAPMALHMTQIQAPAQPIVTQPSNVMVNVQQTQNGGKGSTGIKRAWSSSLFDCFSDMGSCLGVAVCCKCYVMVMYSDMQESACIPLLISSPLDIAFLRVMLRSRENIRGSIMNDICTSFWCYLCAICQVKRDWNMVQSVRARVNYGV